MQRHSPVILMLQASCPDVGPCTGLGHFKSNLRDMQEQGYVDEAGKLRKIPFEVMVRGDKLPVYGETLEDNGRFNEVQSLICRTTARSVMHYCCRC